MCTKIINPEINKFLLLDEKDATLKCRTMTETDQLPIFTKTEKIDGLDFIHKENEFNDFERDKLLFQMLSNEGPHMAVADVNGDKLDDIYICGAKDSPGALYVQDGKGHFQKVRHQNWRK